MQVSGLEHVTEMTAILAARKILYASNRTQSAGDAYMSVQALCQNPDLVMICPESSEAKVRSLNSACRRVIPSSSRRVALPALQVPM